MRRVRSGGRTSQMMRVCLAGHDSCPMGLPLLPSCPAVFCWVLWGLERPRGRIGSVHRSNGARFQPVRSVRTILRAPTVLE